MQQISWVEEPGQTYTGLFKGANGIVRLSLGKKDNSYKASLLPGMALKFFRTGVTSGGIHAMDGLDTFKTNNIFENPFSNHMKE